MTEEIYLTEKDLAKKWSLSPKTLQHWRWLKTGPTYIKIGGRIRYTSNNIKIFEEKNQYLQQSTSCCSLDRCSLNIREMEYASN